MRYAYKVWHSEEHKSPAKRRAGRVLDSAEINDVHERLDLPLDLYAQLYPTFKPSFIPLRPVSRGAIVFIEADLEADAADAWMTAFLVHLNKLHPDLCLICVPLPGPSRADSAKRSEMPEQVKDLVKWIAIDSWNIKVVLTPANNLNWNWTFHAVDGPNGASIVSAGSSTLAFQQALGAALQAVGREGGPESARTDFDNSM